MSAFSWFNVPRVMARAYSEWQMGVERDQIDRDEMVRMLVEIRDFRSDLAAFAKDVERELLARAGERRWVVEELGEVAVRKNTKRSRWDNEGLTAKVVALALDERVLDESTGEYESAHAAVARVLSECSRPSWRLTPLRARNVQIDEYCEQEDAGWSVELPPRRDG